MTRFCRYFFTRSELRGVLILSFGVVIIRGLAYWIDPVVKGSDPDAIIPVEQVVQINQGKVVQPNHEKVVQPNHQQVARQNQVKPKTIEINSADSLALIGLPGIGPSFTKRILKYRSMLGGFVSAGQLMEVYGMDSVRLAGFISRIRIDTSNIRKIDLNNATFKELLAHPYLDYENVKAIARFRDRKGLLESPGELWAAGVLADSLWGYLSHYLVAGKDSPLKEN